MSSLKIFHKKKILLVFVLCAAMLLGLVAARLPLAAGGSLFTEVGNVRPGRTEATRRSAAIGSRRSSPWCDRLRQNTQ